MGQLCYIEDMPRKRPQDRLEHLVRVGTEVFIASQGYQRAQMDDIARDLGVSKGTVYLYVESKEALFDLCVRYADDAQASNAISALPLPTPVTRERGPRRRHRPG